MGLGKQLSIGCNASGEVRPHLGVGQSVRGTYCFEFHFSGVIQEAEPVTVRTDGCVAYTIQLHTPLNVYGEMRTHLLVHTREDGSSSSYARHGDQITPI